MTTSNGELSEYNMENLKTFFEKVRACPNPT